MYKIVKVGAMYQVISIPSGMVQFRSMKRANCKDWIEQIAGQTTG